jgi:hypothetical protein
MASAAAPLAYYNLRTRQPGTSPLIRIFAKKSASRLVEISLEDQRSNLRYSQESSHFKEPFGALVIVAGLDFWKDSGFLFHFKDDA